MNDFSWNNKEMISICGQCHFRDNNPKLCHAVEPPMEKSFIPNNISDCSFIRESQWKRMPKERQEEINEFVKKRSNRYYHNEETT